jgi:starvation-inducible outer membrane lipoprotein
MKPFSTPEGRACRLGAVLASFLLLLACATGISSQSKALVDYGGPFDPLSKNPEGFSGKVVLVGGRILELTTGSTVSEVTVLQHPLDVASDRPKAEKGSSGRFIIQTESFLDPEVFRRGYYITVVGRIVGKREQQVGGHPIVLPRIDPLETKLWIPSAGSSGPSVSFGVGVGSGGSGGGVGVGTWF